MVPVNLISDGPEGAGAVERYLAWDERMVEAIAEGVPLPGFLEVAAEGLANPIAVFDSSLALVAHAGGPPGEGGTIWDDVLSSGYAPVGFYTPDELDGITGASHEDGPVLVRPKRTPSHENLYALLSAGGRDYGALGQVDVAAPFDELQVALAAHVRVRIEQAIERNGGMGAGEGGLAAMLRRLVLGGAESDGMVAALCREAGWDPGWHFEVAACTAPNRVLQTGSLEGRGRIARLERCVRRSVGFQLGHYAVLVFPHGSLDGDRVVERFGEEIASLGLVCGVSEPMPGLSHLHVQFSQCTAAIGELETGQDERIARFCDVALACALSALRGSQNGDVARRPLIDELVYGGFKGDIARGREIVRQLYVYLMCGCNLHRAARLLYVHRNTLAYRVKLAEERLGVELAGLDPDASLSLALSCALALDDSELKPRNLRSKNKHDSDDSWGWYGRADG